MEETLKKILDELKELKGDVKEIKSDVKELDRKMNNVYEQTANNTENHTVVTNALESVMDRLDDLKEDVNQNTIKTLKNENFLLKMKRKLKDK